MKIAIRIINLTTIFLVSALLGFFNYFYTGKITHFLIEMEKANEIVKFFKIYIVVYILTSILLFVCILSYISNLFDDKVNKIIQSIIHIINSISLILSIIFFAIIEININNYLFDNINVGNEYLMFFSIFLIQTFQSIFNLVLSSLGLKYSKNNDEKENTIINKQHQSIKNEIEEMKQQLELKQLKDEYLKLYLQVHDDDKK